MTSVNIRGGFGTQLLSMIGAIAFYGKNLKEFRINIGGYSPEYRALAAIDTLNIQSIFKETRLNKIPMTFVDGTEKFSIFREPITSCFIDLARDILPQFKTDERFPERILHRRTRDRQFLNLSQYNDLQKTWKDRFPNLSIIDDKGDFIEDLNTTKTDWLRIVRAQTVVGAYSTFTLSAAILNPDLQLYIVHPKHYLGRDLLGPIDIEPIEKIVKSFDNMRWTACS